MKFRNFFFVFFVFSAGAAFSSLLSEEDMSEFTDMPAAGPSVFSQPPLYHKRLLGTKAKDRAPVYVFFRSIFGGEDEKLLENRLETLLSCVTNPHLNTRCVGDIIFYMSITPTTSPKDFALPSACSDDGNEKLLILFREFYDFLKRLSDLPGKIIWERPSRKAYLLGIINIAETTAGIGIHWEFEYSKPADLATEFLNNLHLNPYHSGNVVITILSSDSVKNPYSHSFEHYLPESLRLKNTTPPISRKSSVALPGVPILPACEGFVDPVPHVPGHAYPHLQGIDSNTSVKEKASHLESQKLHASSSGQNISQSASLLPPSTTREVSRSPSPYPAAASPIPSPARTWSYPTMPPK